MSSQPLFVAMWRRSASTLKHLFPSIAQMDAGKLIALPAVLYLFVGVSAGILKDILKPLGWL